MLLTWNCEHNYYGEHISNATQELRNSCRRFLLFCFLLMFSINMCVAKFVLVLFLTLFEGK